MKMKNKLTTATLTAIAALLVTQTAVRSYGAGGDASIAASPKVRMMLGKPISTPEDVANLKNGDMVAMACPKCKTIMVTYVSTEKSRSSTETTLGHACPGCEQKFVVVGEGKEKHNVVQHVCKKCGSTDAFCCVMTKVAKPTQGMEEKR
jgi:hypothetical protein